MVQGIIAKSEFEPPSTCTIAAAASVRGPVAGPTTPGLRCLRTPVAGVAADVVAEAEVVVTAADAGEEGFGCGFVECGMVGTEGGEGWDRVGWIDWVIY